MGSSRIRAPWLVLLCTPAALFVSVLLGPSSASALSLQKVGSFDAPTFVTSDPGDPNRLFIVERDGDIQLTEGGSTTTFLDIESIVQSDSGEQGLFSMAFSPDYATNHHFYVAYSGVDDDFHLDEFTAQGDSANPGSRRGVLTIEHSQDRHYGGQLQFGPDGYLYVSTGDNVGDLNSQSLDTLLGKILRISPSGTGPGDYSVPPDNPFAGPTPGEDEIWSYGLRNPWRFSFDRATGALTIGDVGQESWEELNYEPVSAGGGRGDNFGWVCREGMHDFSSDPPCDDPPTLTEPVFEYAHDSSHCAITGGYVVRDQGLGGLYGRYLYADICAGELRSLNPGIPMASGDRSEGVSVAGGEAGGPSSFGEDADWRIYVASLDGPVYRLTGGSPPSNDFSFGKVKKNKKKGTAKLTLRVPGPGELELATTKKVRGDDDSADEAGKEKLSIKPKGKAKKRLNNKGKAKVKASVTYIPFGLSPHTEDKKIRLVKR